MKSTNTFLIVFSFLVVLPCTKVQSYDLPAVNLGFTTFVDVPPAQPGLYFTQYIHNWTSKRFKDSEGNSLLPGFADEKLDVWISITQLFYYSPEKLPLGTTWGLDILIPVVSIDLDFGTSNVSGLPADNGAGLGDIIIAPIFQWDPIMGKNGPLFVHRIELQLILPTGKYDDDKELNPGSNFFSFDPYWAGTFFIAPRWTTSLRLHYLWNDKNHDPNRNFVGAEDTKAGQAIHANFTVDYEVIQEKLRVGLNSFFLKQITDTEIDGRNAPGNRREQVFGIGPGAVWQFFKNDFLFLNTYYETEVENRPQGRRINLRWVHIF
ncbi:Protein involved in meta-pathway of phenol degradation [uncultured Desulfobacterium sp.]|uniref:Protein involved in meta-pathway of phenol degradation n=1 Tax=uncultured Desulfobacterium sp. TaxID=201089 RepID=A0A445MXS8_9BACT|nr:Protein involved in meta-pathway of phenol degradation [uncultured Desulfobacterium sp.]